MQTKICVLVTHQLQYLKDIKHIILMDAGLISAHDTYQNITSENSFLSRSTSIVSEKGGIGIGAGDEAIAEDILVRIIFILISSKWRDLHKFTFLLVFFRMRNNLMKKKIQVILTFVAQLKRHVKLK